MENEEFYVYDGCPLVCVVLVNSHEESC